MTSLAASCSRESSKKKLSLLHREMRWLMSELWLDVCALSNENLSSFFCWSGMDYVVHSLEAST